MPLTIQAQLSNLLTLIKARGGGAGARAKKEFIIKTLAVHI
jgi:hypothetical protein